MSETKERRLSFAQGYADAWAKRTARDDSTEYERGYDEGKADRKASDERGARRRRR